ncbi:hypothetical protein ACHAQH_008565 [Verticillium albo-atrum]
MRQRTGYQWVHISLLLVSLETRYFNGLTVEVPETVLPLKDTVIKFSSADLLTWPSFTANLFDHLRPLPPAIDLTNRDLWSLSYASNFSGKKIVTVPNTDKYATPSNVVDKQESVTPLRPDEYVTPVKEEKKRKIKREDTSPVSERRKRIKREKQMKQEKGKVDTDEIRQEINVKMEPDEPWSSPPDQSPTDDELGDAVEETVEREDVIDLREVGSTS